ncbi:MAG: substrate-binding domain-containing protein, partial [Sedimentisphaerales bacterium]|nr:substrate-binding domain-containing protein [Sedimentisphaerales bacterium]
MSQQDYHCVFESGGLNRGDENRGICSLIRKGLDGFIVGPSSNPDDDHKPLMELIENKVPVVLIDRPFGNYEVDIVMSDLEMGAEEIVEHFHHLGHQKIAYLGVTGFSRTDERLDGYRSAMQRLDLKIYPQWIQEIERLSLTLEEEEASCLDIIVTVAGTRVSKRHCRNAVETLLRLPEADRPTAILTVNTTVAEMLGETLSEHNINIPEDIAVAAFSELSSKEMQGKGRLICYQQSNYRIGKYAARLLIDRIKTPDRGPTRILLPGRLIHPDSALPVRRML